MTTQGAILIANILWFGVFVVGVFYFHWPAISFAIPVLFHWTPNDFEK